MEKQTHHQKLHDLIGSLPQESGFIKRMRFHQAWWRAFVLGEEQGKWPNSKDLEKRIGSTIPEGQESGKNFLTENTLAAVQKTQLERKETEFGMMEPDRLFNNLLSSQPLCFNFFGELKLDLDLAAAVMGCFYPAVTRVTNVWFEFAPLARYTQDNSAFDIAVELEIGDRKGLLGMECKFTEPFSQKEYDKPAYREIFQKSDVFKEEYATYISSRYNQLFRNQLMAEAVVQNGDYEFVHTGLFCHQEDQNATRIGAEFADLLDLEENFQVITFRDFMERVQQLPLSWEQRDWSNLLWARYCSTRLSESLIEELR
ncbi:MAG: hypothetical protein DRI65_13975 [Chloroflexota bacterium]|nr:MAG: hypothetical protein DRI65_13975 [Chloroflexota bacterium]